MYDQSRCMKSWTYSPAVPVTEGREYPRIEREALDRTGPKW